MTLRIEYGNVRLCFPTKYDSPRSWIRTRNVSQRGCGFWPAVDRRVSAFLHRRGVAHLDIKPQNIVARPNRLFIIDFDISVRVDGPNALIDRWCGTPGWMAPEIGRQDRPRCSYSPIRADLWSCGLVLRYLASNGAVKENPFKILTRQLLNKNPRLRPLLHRQSPFRVGHSLSKPQVRMKRKPDPLPHGAKRLAIGTVHP